MLFHFFLLDVSTAKFKPHLEIQKSQSATLLKQNQTQTTEIKNAMMQCTCWPPNHAPKTLQLSINTLSKSTIALLVLLVCCLCPAFLEIGGNFSPEDYTRVDLNPWDCDQQ